ncbi:MAG: hypothetical protein B7733_13695 [Myxococcales bacterium FL481]|nr:MAG: hypothetical protein B7733_13695 [Myxococcales bacterium FL481]
MPRRVLPGAIKMITRRCSERRFFLRPDSDVVQAWLYCLALVQHKYGLVVHDFVMMSNHHHIIVRDQSDSPECWRDLHALLARCLNARFGRWAAFWDDRPYNDVRLVDEHDVISKAAYVLSNPVDAGLVKYSCDWLGATSCRLAYGQSIEVRRPKFFFSNDMPETLTLAITRPDILPALSDAEVRQRVLAATKDREWSGHERLRKAGGTYLGMKRVLRQDREASPNSREPRRGIRPTVAAMNQWARIQALQLTRQWRAQYEDARRRWLEGEAHVLFPYGTYLLRRVHAVCVAAPP